MLKQRFFTALCLVMFVIALLFYGNSQLIIWSIALLTMLCAYEWTQLIPIKSTACVFVGCFLLIMLLIIAITMYAAQTISILFVIGFWSAVFSALCTFPTSQRYWGYMPIVIAAGYWVFYEFIISFEYLLTLEHGRALIMYLLILVWTADIAAYFFGKYFGKQKLIPQVSPGKTQEGLFGGFIITIMIAYIASYYFMPSNLVHWFAVASIVFIYAVIGDLFISMLKRRVSLKDTGTLLPGHGGLLDRLDSLIAAAPVFYSLAVHHWI